MKRTLTKLAGVTGFAVPLAVVATSSAAAGGAWGGNLNGACGIWALAGFAALVGAYPAALAFGVAATISCHD